MASEAKQSRNASACGLDCFVAEPVIGPRSARTRWLLAMTGSAPVALHQAARDQRPAVNQHDRST
jgi:hypothetical protein